MAYKKRRRSRKRKQYVKQVVPIFLKDMGNDYKGHTRSGKINTTLNLDSKTLSIYGVPSFEGGQMRNKTVTLKLGQATTKHGQTYHKCYLPRYGTITVFPVSGEFDYVANIPWFVRKS